MFCVFCVRTMHADWVQCITHVTSTSGWITEYIYRIPCQRIGRPSVSTSHLSSPPVGDFPPSSVAVTESWSPWPALPARWFPQFTRVFPELYHAVIGRDTSNFERLNNFDSKRITILANVALSWEIAMVKNGKSITPLIEITILQVQVTQWLFLEKSFKHWSLYLPFPLSFLF